MKEQERLEKWKQLGEQTKEWMDKLKQKKEEADAAKKQVRWWDLEQGGITKLWAVWFRRSWTISFKFRKTESSIRLHLLPLSGMSGIWILENFELESELNTFS